MAELIIKIGHGANYEDGDVIAAFNRRRTRCVHAEHVCHPWRAGVNRHGWRPVDTAAEHLHAICCQYRFERISQTEISRTDLLTGEVELFGPVPNERGEAIDVEAWVARRAKERADDGGPKLAVFGDAGREIWYGGCVDTSHTCLDRVWQKIAEKTGRLEAEEEFQLWPMGRLDIRHHLAVRTEDFSDEESEALVRPAFEWTDYERRVKKLDAEGQPIIVAKRHVKTNWRDLLGDLKATEQQVLDREFPVGRDVVFSVDRLSHRSKEQPAQGRRDRLHDKELGRSL